MVSITAVLLESGRARFPDEAYERAVNTLNESLFSAYVSIEISRKQQKMAAKPIQYDITSILLTKKSMTVLKRERGREGVREGKRERERE